MREAGGGDQIWSYTQTPQGCGEDLNGIGKSSVTDMHLQEITWADTRKIDSWGWETRVCGGEIRVQSLQVRDPGDADWVASGRRETDY